MTRIQAAAQVTTGGTSATPQITLTSVAVGSTVIVYAAILVASDPSGDWTVGSVSDDQGNVYTARTGYTYAPPGTLRAAIVVAHSAVTTGGTLVISFNLTNAGGTNNRYFELGAEEWSGLDGEDTWDTNELIVLTSTDISAGPITTAEATDLIVGAAGFSASDSAVNFVSPTSWTTSYRQDNAQATMGLDAGYWEPGAVQTTYTAQWSHDNPVGIQGAGVVVAFLAAATPAAAGTDAGAVLASEEVQGLTVAVGTVEAG